MDNAAACIVVDPFDPCSDPAGPLGTTFEVEAAAVAVGSDEGTGGVELAGLVTTGAALDVIIFVHSINSE